MKSNEKTQNPTGSEEKREDITTMPEADSTQNDSSEETPEAMMLDPVNPQGVDTTKLKKKLEEDKALMEKLEDRALPATGDPNAKVADPYTVGVTPRYNIVQNRSEFILVVPDLKTNVEDMGLVLQPGEVIILGDFYTPMEVNKSKGLRWAATQCKGVGDNMALVPLRTEEEGASFKVPERVKHAPGTTLEDTAHNDFDDRYEELEKREAKREEKLIKKTLGSRRTKQHGSAPSHV